MKALKLLSSMTLLLAGVAGVNWANSTSVSALSAFVGVLGFASIVVSAFLFLCALDTRTKTSPPLTYVQQTRELAKEYGLPFGDESIRILSGNAIVTLEARVSLLAETDTT